MRNLTKADRDELATNNQKLVFYVARWYRKYLCDPDEIYGAGIIGLVEASKTYDPDKGIMFTTYATRCIRNRMSKVIRKHLKRVAITPLQVRYEDGSWRDIEIPCVEDFTNAEVEYWYINCLSERDRVIVGMLMQGASQREIGESLGVSQVSVSRFIQQIRNSYTQIA